MIKSKKSSKHSTKIHTSKNRPVRATSHTFAKPLVIVIIVIAIAVVLISLFCTFFFSPERQVKDTISRLTSEYYENYFYEKYTSAAYDTQNVQKYTERGFSPIYLRQILLYDDQKNEEYQDFITEYCNADKTYVVIYPEPPFDKKSYHLEISYACNF